MTEGNEKVLKATQRMIRISDSLAGVKIEGDNAEKISDLLEMVDMGLQDIQRLIT